MALDKSTWNKDIKVPQSEIDKIKKLGMSAALRMASANPVAGGSGMNVAQSKQAAFVEGVRRMYGDARFQTAIHKAKSSPGPIGVDTPKSKSNFKGNM